MGVYRMIGANVSLKDVCKEYNGKNVVDSVYFKIDKGDFLTILGPSGAGKTTLLKMIAGFDEMTSGQILINSEDISNIPTNKRNIGMLFQNYALFPHMTVEENVAFPLKVRKYSKIECKKKVDEILERVKLSDYSKRLPRQLSGGQQQRVALARAIVFNPPILLLDEPMAALDKQLRKHMQLEIKQIHHELGLTTISVTHDQEEALTMATKVCVMKDGRVEQIASPYEIYSKPSNTFVANFIGEANIFKGKIVSSSDRRRIVQIDDYTFVIHNSNYWFADDEKVNLVIRPEKIKLLVNESLSDFDGYILKGKISQVIYIGDVLKLLVTTPTGLEFKIKIFSNNSSPINLGEAITFGIKSEDMLLVRDN